MCVEADAQIRDYSGRLPEYYFESREQKQRKENIRSEYNGLNTKHGKLSLGKHSFRSKPKTPTDKTATFQLPAKVLIGSYQVSK